MSKIEFDNFRILFTQCQKLAEIKNKLYGIKNLLIFDGLGILTRMNDKIARLNNLLIKPESSNIDFEETTKETLNDTILDLINYSIYLYLFKNKLLLKKGEK